MDEKIEELLLNTEDNMQKALKALSNEFSLVRSGRANPKVLDCIKISYYGAETPINQIATIQVLEGTQLSIKPFDKSTLTLIESAINASDIGLPPVNDGNVIRLNFPKLTEEKRKEIVKEVEKKAEMGKVFIRNERRNANDALKKLSLPEDLEHSTSDDIQKLTDDYIQKVDNLTKEKTQEVLKI